MAPVVFEESLYLRLEVIYGLAVHHFFSKVVPLVDHSLAKEVFAGIQSGELFFDF